MKIFLAGSGFVYVWEKNNFFNFNRLESFLYVNGEEKNINKYNSFLLDSGAFTYMNKNKNKIDWSEYIVKYANFINNWNVKYFFELDIDNIVGLDNVKILTKKLESLTQKQCIPVWHKNRGLDYWNNIVKDYNYVAIGGIVTKEIKNNQYDIFTNLINTANKYNTKVHGLGFTNINKLHKYKFYSVDSTSWLSGNRYGIIHTFINKEMKTHKAPMGKRVLYKKAVEHNFNEWVKFSKYAEEYL